MCSIMTWCSDTADMERFMEGFKRTESRGPDDMRVIETGNGIMGFQRLSIMGLTEAGMQPFPGKIDGLCAMGRYTDSAGSKKRL